MKVEKNKVVSVSYQLQAGNKGAEKSFVETADAAHPFTFLFGAGGLIEAFENNLKDLKIGDKFDFEIDAASAYGVIDKEAIVNLPKDIFKVEGKIDEDLLMLGNIVPMTDEEGHRLNGKVVDIKENEVIMDFNHPLAGQDLHFKGEVLSLREATSEEIDHGHVHDGTHHH